MGTASGSLRRSGRLVRAAAAGLILTVLTLAAGARAPERHYVLVSEKSRVWFESWSTFDDFVGTTSALRGIAIVPEPPDLRGTHGRIEIVVDSFRTGIGLRDGDLRDAMETERYPLIVFLLEDTRVRKDAEAGGDVVPRANARTLPATPVVLEGWLTIRAETVRVEIPAWVERRGDTLRVTGTMTTRFTDFGMEPPSRLFGAVAVEDSLRLHFDAAFIPASRAGS